MKGSRDDCPVGRFGSNVCGKAAEEGDTSKRSMLAKSGLDVNGTIEEIQVLHCSLLHF
jgi:hypothetical protein